MPKSFNEPSNFNDSRFLCWKQSRGTVTYVGILKNMYKNVMFQKLVHIF